MKKTEIDSILLVNLYFTSYKIKNPNSPTTELVRRYFYNKINRALVNRKNLNNKTLNNKAIILLSVIVFYLS